jgi:hypothetical protein
MRKNLKLAGLAAVAALALAGCNQTASEEPAPAPDATETVSADDGAEPAPEASPDAGGTPDAEATAPASDLDYAALQDRSDPERLIRFYVAAIREGRWNAAASAWSSDAQMTPDELKTRFGGAPNNLAIGKADSETAGGTMFYIVPVTGQRADGAEVTKGDLVLRRASDAPGASEEQLNWRIERSTLNITE